MSKYTVEDFKNAKFAEHSLGYISMRLLDGESRPWVQGHKVRTSDKEMVEDGWTPVPVKPTITESRVEEIAKALKVNVWSAITVIEMAFGDDSIVADQEPTEVEKMDKDIQEVDLHLTSIQLAKALIERGWTKTTEGNNE